MKITRTTERPLLAQVPLAAVHLLPLELVPATQQVLSQPLEIIIIIPLPLILLLVFLDLTTTTIILAVLCLVVLAQTLTILALLHLGLEVLAPITTPAPHQHLAVLVLGLPAILEARLADSPTITILPVQDHHYLATIILLKIRALTSALRPALHLELALTIPVPAPHYLETITILVLRYLVAKTTTALIHLHHLVV